MQARITLALVLMGCAAPQWAATLERLSLDDLTVKSTAIVRGTVGDSWTATTDGIIYTHYRIQVSETLKGSSSSSVEVMIPGGALNGLHQTFAGAPTLTKGAEFVFFLWTSKAGITWITGLTQGLFALPGDGSSDPTASRPASAELILDPRTARQVKDSPVSMRLSELRSRVAAALAAKGGAQ
ncbi:MAG TPA: hypothetical protein VMJ75_18415 [Candidatus Acidoferrales bacterium]|nr:hypothetical protein [Candidatus Acidoferrales bacterium]